MITVSCSKSTPVLTTCEPPGVSARRVAAQRVAHLMHEVRLHHERAVGTEVQRTDARADSIAHVQSATPSEDDEDLLAVMSVNGGPRIRRKRLLPHLNLRRYGGHDSAADTLLPADAPHAPRAARRRAASRATAPGARRRSAERTAARRANLRVWRQRPPRLRACNAAHRLPPASRCMRDMRCRLRAAEQAPAAARAARLGSTCRATMMSGVAAAAKQALAAELRTA